MMFAFNPYGFAQRHCPKHGPQGENVGLHVIHDGQGIPAWAGGIERRYCLQCLVEHLDQVLCQLTEGKGESQKPDEADE